MEQINILRLFTGTFIDPVIFRDKYDEIKQYFGDLLFGKWVEPENLHFTYQFIGDFPSSKLPLLKEKLTGYLSGYESELQVRGISAFPDTRHPKVLIAPVFSPDNKLFEIFDETNKILAEFGYKPDYKKYKPHVTLMRIKELKKNFPEFFFGRYKSYEFGTMSFFRYNLISSELTRSGPVYKIV